MPRPCDVARVSGNEAGNLGGDARLAVDQPGNLDGDWVLCGLACACQ
jgi:hypothetical protein